jgi:hypothetical protein
MEYGTHKKSYLLSGFTQLFGVSYVEIPVVSDFLFNQILTKRGAL